MSLKRSLQTSYSNSLYSKVKAGTAVAARSDCKQSRQTDSSKTKRCTEFDSTVAISQTFIHTRSSIFQMTLDSGTIFMLLRFHEFDSTVAIHITVRNFVIEGVACQPPA